MKTEKQVKELREGLYQSVCSMKANNQPEYSLFLPYVRMLDYILNDKDNMEPSNFAIFLSKFEWDSVFKEA